MTLRLLLASLGALLLASCGEPARDWPEPSPALWEVTAPEGQRGWLFGTIHSLPAEARWRTPVLDEALADAGVVVVEIAELADANKATGMFNRYSRNAGLPPLSERVAPEDRGDLAAFLERAGMADDAFAEMDTWAAALTLSNRARTLDRGQNVDLALIGGGREVVGLESHALQYGMFDALPPQEQADLLMALARDSGNEVARVEAWLTGDLGALEKASEGLLSDPELRAALQTNRNLRWALQVGELIDAGRRPFVAVGTGHLFGEQSLPALLDARGYTVRRIQ